MKNRILTETNGAPWDIEGSSDKEFSSSLLLRLHYEVASREVDYYFNDYDKDKDERSLKGSGLNLLNQSESPTQSEIEISLEKNIRIIRLDFIRYLLVERLLTTWYEAVKEREIEFLTRVNEETIPYWEEYDSDVIAIEKIYSTETVQIALKYGKPLF